MKKSLMIIWVLICPCAPLLAQDNYVLQSHDGILLQINEYGKGGPVVLLAGGPGFNAAYLKPLWDHLPNNRVIVPDQRGTGHSSLRNIDTAKMSVDCYVEDLELLRKHLRLKKMVIAGHSWGGMLALAYSAKYPGRVDRLILLGSGGVTEKFLTYFNSNINMRLREDDLSEAKAAHSLASKLKAIWPGYFYNRESALATRPLVDTNLANQHAAKINHLTLKDYKRTGHQRSVELLKYKNPVYLIQGRQDPVGESTVYETKEILPQSQIFFIENSGHLPWLENDQSAVKFFELINAALQK